MGVEVESVGETRETEGFTEATALRSPGLLRNHYSPKARLVVLPWTGDAEFAVKLSALQTKHAAPPARTFVIAHTHIPLDTPGAEVCVIPHDAEAFARAIYAELHRCDESGAALIVVEALPDGPEWQAIANRLQRAAAE